MLSFASGYSSVFPLLIVEELGQGDGMSFMISRTVALITSSGILSVLMELDVVDDDELPFVSTEENSSSTWSIMLSTTRTTQDSRPSLLLEEREELLLSFATGDPSATISTSSLALILLE